MEILIKTIFLGIIEGITEFLPISSTGHLIIFSKILNFDTLVGKEFNNLFNVVIQMGAILAIVILYFSKIKDTLKNFKTTGYKFWIIIIIGFIPAAIFGFLFSDYLDIYLMKVPTVALALIVGGIAMIIVETKLKKKNSIQDIKDISVKQSLSIGMFQVLSLWPGMSRSASTIIGGWVNGLDSIRAAEYSFFLALPTISAASLYKLFKYIKYSNTTLEVNHILILIIGFIVSFLVAIFVVKKFIEYLKQKPMKIFGYYRIILGCILILFFLLGFITNAST